MLFFGSIPYFKCLVRREYTRDLESGHGQFLPALAIAVECRRGRMLGFQVLFTEQAAGAMFRVPLEAICSKTCKRPPRGFQPWDCLSDEFSVEPIALIHEMRAYVLPRRWPGRYLFTVHYARSDLTDDPEQSKQHHVVQMDAGWFAAVPNSRLLIEDLAFFEATKERPDFAVLTHAFSAE